MHDIIYNIFYRADVTVYLISGEHRDLGLGVWDGVPAPAPAAGSGPARAVAPQPVRSPALGQPGAHGLSSSGWDSGGQRG